MDCPRMAIIGGGLGGLVCAVALAQRRIPCSVYEKGQDDRTGGAISIEPNGIAVLDHIGIQREIQSVGRIYDGTFIYSQAGDLLMRSTRSPTHPSVRFERPILQRALVRLARDVGVTVLFDHELISLDIGEDAVRLAFANGVTESAGRVIAADGINSSIRGLFLPEVQPLYENITAFGGFFDASRLQWQDGKFREYPMVQVHSDGGVSGCSLTDPNDPSRMFCFVNVKMDNEQEAMEAKRNPRVTVLECLTRQQDALAGVAEDLETPIVWPFYILPEIPTWRFHQDKIILIGEAAHGMSGLEWMTSDIALGESISANLEA